MSAEIIQFVPKHMRVKPLEEQLPGTELIEHMNSAGYSEPMELPSTWQDATVTRFRDGEPICLGDGSKEPA